MNDNAPASQDIPPSHRSNSTSLRAGLLAALCVVSTAPALADFSNVVCRDNAGNVSISGDTKIPGNTYSNNATISITRDNLSNTNGFKNAAAAVLEWQSNVGYGKGPVQVYNGPNGTMRAVTSDSATWAAGFWADQIYGNPAVADLTVNNYGTMDGQAPNSTGATFGCHSYNLYGGANVTNHAGATCSASGKGPAIGIETIVYYGAINFLNNGTATGASTGFEGAEINPRGIFLHTYDHNLKAPLYCENNGYISATTTGGETNYTYGAWVWAQGGRMDLINRGTIIGTSWGGTKGQATGVYCGSNGGDSYVDNSGQMIANGGPGWALGIENDDNYDVLGHIYVRNSGVISNGVTSGQACCGIYGGIGIVLWVSSGPTYITNTPSGKIHGGYMGIWAGVYGGPITIYNSGDIYGGSGGAFHLGDGDDTVYLTGTGKVTGVMDGDDGNNSLVINLDGTLEYVNGNAANSGPNLSSYNLGTSGSIVVSGRTYSWRNFNVSGTVTAGVADGTYKLIARHSGKAMQVYNSGTADGTQIDQYTYSGGVNQQWIVSGTGTGSHKIISVQTGKGLDIYNGYSANGTKVELWSYWGGRMQQFKFTSTDSGYYRITPDCAPGSCLDVTGGSTADGATVHLWQWLGNDNQQWSFQPVDGTYKIIAQHSGKALDAYGAGITNGTQIIQWTYGGGNNQKWTASDIGNGYYKIMGVQSGKSLDIDYSSGGTANGTKVQLWSYWNGPSQQFKFDLTDTGHYRISPKCAPGSCLDVVGVSTANGARVHLWQWLNGQNQKWSLQVP